MSWIEYGSSKILKFGKKIRSKWKRGYFCVNWKWCKLGLKNFPPLLDFHSPKDRKSHYKKALCKLVWGHWLLFQWLGWREWWCGFWGYGSRWLIGLHRFGGGVGLRVMGHDVAKGVANWVIEREREIEKTRRRGGGRRKRIRKRNIKY